MSHQANSGFTRTVIDSLEFARTGGRISGQTPIAALSRIADLLAGNAGSLECEVRGERDREGNSFLLLDVSGVLQLRCQRCLESMDHALCLSSRLLLVPPGGDWPDDELEDDESDAIEADGELALLPLIEEEVLLVLPIAPRHDTCEPPAPMDEHREPSVFAALAQFKKH